MVTKKVLRNVLYKYVPQSLVDKPKQGFSVPLRKWFKDGELRDWGEELLDPKKLSESEFLNKDVVRRIWTNYLDKDSWYEYIWYILIFQQWLSANKSM